MKNCTKNIFFIFWEFLTPQSRTKKNKIPKTFLFTVGEWVNNKKLIFKFIKKHFKNTKFIAIRSSAINEDKKKFSQAGKYHTELFVNIKNRKKISRR